MTQHLRGRWRWRMSAAAAATLLITGVGVALIGQTPATAQVGTPATSAGCGKAPTLTNGTHTITSSGQSRSFILRLPNNYDRNHPYRLIFGFHWLGGNATDVANGGWVQPYYGLLALPNNSAIFVAPQGLNNGWANNGGRDVTFVDDMIRLIENDLCVDTTQRFSLGFSYGGGMSYAIACARPNVFRAVAIYSAGIISGCSGGTSPVAYLQVHGTRDSVLPISGARTMRDNFVRNNGCTPANPPEPPIGSGQRTSYDYTGCTPGYPVSWHVFDGDHDAAPTDPNGTQWLPGVTWQFFSQFQSSPPPSSPPPSSPPPSSPPPWSPPPSSPPPSSPPPVSPPPGQGGCTASYQEINSWPGGFQGEVTVRAGNSSINGWTVTMSFPGGTTINQLWNGRLSGSGSNYTVSNETWNGSIGANGSVSFGFLGSGSPATPTVTCTAS